MFAFVGVMSSTPVRTLSAGSTVVAPNGEINAEIDTRKMIHVFIRELNTEYGGPDTCRCNISLGPLFSISISWDISLSCSASFFSSDTETAVDSLMVVTGHEGTNVGATDGEIEL